MIDKILQWPLTIETGTSKQIKGRLADTADIMNFAAETLEQTEGVAVIWLDNAVVWGKYENGTIALADGSSPDWQHLQEIRIFNADEELQLRRSRNKLLWRYINDNTGTISEYVDSIGRLWGQKVSEADGWTVLEDKQRKLKLTVPTGDANAEFYGLQTRSYICCDAITGQAGYGDYRYMAVRPAGRND